jgi:hypothetical protein
LSSNGGGGDCLISNELTTTIPTNLRSVKRTNALALHQRTNKEEEKQQTLPQFKMPSQPKDSK